jgi:hypothetical protein
VIRDFAQKTPAKIAEWPSRKPKIWGIIRDYPPNCFRDSQSPEDENDDEDEPRMNIDNL